MSNNSSVLPSPPVETLDDLFDGQFYCILRHLLNKTVSYAQALEACSEYEDFAKLGTGAAVVFWLAGIFIIIANIVVIWKIIRTQILRKPIHLYLANLAMSDFMSGFGLLYYTAVDQMQIGQDSLHSRLYSVNVVAHSQVMSASALALLSMNAYIAVIHPIFFHVHAPTAKRDAGIAIASSWIVLSLVVFSPSMGWNCLDMPTPDCSSFYPRGFVGLLAAVILIPAIIMLFANISIFIAVKKRQKNRLGQPGGALANQDSGPAQNSLGQHQPDNPAQDEVERKFKKSVQKARTVLIHVAMAFGLWLSSLALVPICGKNVNMCPLSTGRRGVIILMTLNSAINPITSILRIPELREGIWQGLTAIPRVLVTVLRGNRVNPQNELPQNAANVQGPVAVATAGGSEQNRLEQPAVEYSKSPVSQGVAGTEGDLFNRKIQNLAIVEID